MVVGSGHGDSPKYVGEGVALHGPWSRSHGSNGLSRYMNWYFYAVFYNVLQNAPLTHPQMQGL